MKKILWLMTILILATHLFSQPKTYSNYVQWVRPVSTITVSGDLNVNFPEVQVVSGTVSVNNFPSLYITSGTTSLNDSVLNRVVIRNASPDRNLNVNTYNGIDVRLMNNTGTLISDTTPLPVNYSIFTSSYVDVNITNGVVKSGSGYLKNVIVGTAGSGSSLVINDGSKKIAEIDTSSIRIINFDISFTTNLTITTTGTTPAKITIVYR
jgi:hypothetical protein